MREPPQQQPTALQEEETTHPPEDGVGPAIDQPANERLRLQGADGGTAGQGPGVVRQLCMANAMPLSSPCDLMPSILCQVSLAKTDALQQATLCQVNLAQCKLAMHQAAAATHLREHEAQAEQRLRGAAHFKHGSHSGQQCIGAGAAQAARTAARLALSSGELSSGGRLSIGRLAACFGRGKGVEIHAKGHSANHIQRETLQALPDIHLLPTARRAAQQAAQRFGRASHEAGMALQRLAGEEGLPRGAGGAPALAAAAAGGG